MNREEALILWAIDQANISTLHELTGDIRLAFDLAEITVKMRKL